MGQHKKRLEFEISSHRYAKHNQSTWNFSISLIGKTNHREKLAPAWYTKYISFVFGEKVILPKEGLPALFSSHPKWKW